MKRSLLFGWILFALFLLVFTSAFEFLTNNQGSFDQGTYVNTTYNITLQGLQLNSSRHENITAGTYTSMIFDAGRNATWQSITLDRKLTQQEYLFVVEGTGSVYASHNGGVNWTKRNNDYGHGSNTRDMMADDKYVYILYSNSGKEVWRSSDVGRTWILMNSTISGNAVLVSEADSRNNLYVISGPGTVYKSNTSGTTWTVQGDFNGGGATNARALAINGTDALFVVDGNDAVYMSTNEGVNWTQRISDYGGGAVDDMDASNSSLYILFNKQIYRSNNSGASWGIINNSFTPYSQDGLRLHIARNNYFYVIDDPGRIFRSLDQGFTWKDIGDFNNGASNNALGLTSLLISTNVTYQVRSCSLSNCSDGTFQGPTGAGSVYHAPSSSFSFLGRYFQYWLNLTAQDGYITPDVYNITTSYLLSQLSSTANLTLNGTAGNITTLQGRNITILGELIGTNGTLNISIDSLVEASGNAPLTYIKNFTTNGTFAVGLWYYGDENFTASNATYFVTVQPEQSSGSNQTNQTNQTSGGSTGGSSSSSSGPGFSPNTGNSAFDSKYRSGEAPATAQRSPSVPSPSSPSASAPAATQTPTPSSGLDSITGAAVSTSSSRLLKMTPSDKVVGLVFLILILAVLLLYLIKHIRQRNEPLIQRFKKVISSQPSQQHSLYLNNLKKIYEKDSLSRQLEQVNNNHVFKQPPQRNIKIQQPLLQNVQRTKAGKAVVALKEVYKL